MKEFVTDFYQFLKVRKKFYLIPAILILLLFVGLLVATQGTVIAPFIYTIF